MRVACRPFSLVCLRLLRCGETSLFTLPAIFSCCLSIFSSRCLSKTLNAVLVSFINTFHKSHVAPAIYCFGGYPQKRWLPPPVSTTSCPAHPLTVSGPRLSSPPLVLMVNAKCRATLHIAPHCSEEYANPIEHYALHCTVAKPPQKIAPIE